MVKYLSSIVIIFLLISCNTTDIQNSNKINIYKLEKQWTHSREEETDSIQIYRPSSSMEFPASRFRQIYSFQNSGVCEYLVLAPNDSHYLNKGFWSFKSKSRTLSVMDSSYQIIKKYEVVKVTDELLELIKLL